MTSAQPSDTGITVHNLGGVPAVTFTRTLPRNGIGEAVMSAIQTAIPGAVHDLAKK